MCYPCRHCGQCELKRPRSYGVCPLCSFANDPHAETCERCGFAFPPRAGESQTGERDRRAPLSAGEAGGEG